MLGPICVEQQISDPFIQLIKKIYIPKQRSFIYLTNSCNITFQQSFIRAVGRFDCRFQIHVLLDFSVCDNKFPEIYTKDICHKTN